MFYYIQIILYNINFVKIKILNPNIKNETQNEMQHILQVHTLHKCHETAQVGPSFNVLSPIKLMCV